ncbi:MAG: hypothetical protein Q8K32_10930 [Archangium sp.]|nr:hypothetical protein [Archangium sp.]
MAGTNRRYVRSKAKSWALGVSSTGKEQIAVSFLLPADPGLELGERHLAWYGYFTDATAERTIESLRCMGFEGDDLTQLEGLDKNEVELVIEDEEYEGHLNEKIQFINKAGGAMVKTPLVGEKAASFAAQMKAKFRAFDAGNGKRTTKPAAAAKPAAGGPIGDEPPPLADADIPF